MAQDNQARKFSQGRGCNHFFDKAQPVDSPVMGLFHDHILGVTAAFDDKTRNRRRNRRPNAMPIKDRRATSRFQPAPGDRVFYGDRTAPIRDLSLEGVFVCDPDPLPVGSDVTFTLRAGHQDIALQGIVRHSLDQEGMGIEFMTLTAVSKRRLRIHIASLVTAASHVAKV
jgi:hypothetical protein